MSYQVVISTTSSRWLPFGTRIGYQPVPSYPRHADVDLLLMVRPGPAGPLQFPPIVIDIDVPTPSVFQLGPIPTGGVIRGWMTFVVPVAAGALLTARRRTSSSTAPTARSLLAQIRLY